MTKDDIIRMAREAGFNHEGFDWDEIVFPLVERFAAIVAAAEREAIAQMIQDAPPLVDFAKNEHDGCLMCGFTPKLAAEAIRARGENG